MKKIFIGLLCVYFSLSAMMPSKKFEMELKGTCFSCKDSSFHITNRATQKSTEIKEVHLLKKDCSRFQGEHSGLLRFSGSRLLPYFAWARYKIEQNEDYFCSHSSSELVKFLLSKGVRKSIESFGIVPLPGEPGKVQLIDLQTFKKRELSFKPDFYGFISFMSVFPDKYVVAGDASKIVVYDYATLKLLKYLNSKKAEGGSRFKDVEFVDAATICIHFDKEKAICAALDT